MTINVKISLCKITRASKLFQRNFYLPLLRPLSPKDALRRKLITGQNVLGNRIEHYIPVLINHEDKLREKRQRVKGQPVIKKRVKKKDNNKYVAPFFDENLENHGMLEALLAGKGKAKDQHYIYEVFDKNCVLVLPHLMEKAIKDKDIIDITIAQRSEKIVVRLANGRRVVMPLAKFDDKGALYRGSGWTKEYIEEEHHHGKDTFGLARVFEAKDAGIEDWELELMKTSSRRKRKHKAEENPEWKMVVQAAADNIDWDQFEEDSKQIMEEIEEKISEETIAMSVEDFEKTVNVNEKLADGGEEVLEMLPTLKEIPELVRNLEAGDLCEVEDVAGIKVTMDDGKTFFVAGQIVTTEEEEEVFIPGQTVENEEGEVEYAPGITVLMEEGPSLIPGLIFGEEEQTPMFLPGQSTITESGQLEFESTEYDEVKEASTPPAPTKKKSLPVEETQVPQQEEAKEEFVFSFRPEKQALEETLLEYEERKHEKEELERKRYKERLERKIVTAESKVDKIRYQVRMKLKSFKLAEVGRYEPLKPVVKSKKLEELERAIVDGSFEDERTKVIMEKVRRDSRKCKHMTLLSSLGLDGEFGSGNIV